MSEVAIRCENIGKQYRFGERERYTALRDVVAGALTAPFRKLRSSLNGPNAPAEEVRPKTFWALKDISFDVNRGELVGIIGQNGAGKSTLLKILSRITAPTEGHARIHGRVGSLLEVGTGFHPELTGRENIYLNGAILGMKKTEIARKFDEMVAFAEIEKFIDTPVKRYSSGMYVRLAFAVAAHLEPEVLVVDEVLAVGDAEFQKKCLGKMNDVSKHGRTVIFVSHNMSAIETLCSKAIYLKEGFVHSYGDAKSEIMKYVSSFAQADVQPANLPRRLGAEIDLLNLSFSKNPVTSGDSVEFRIEFQSESRTCSNEIALLFYSARATRVAILDLRTAAGMEKIRADGVRAIVGNIHSIDFVEGDYSVGIFISNGSTRGEFLDIVRLGVLRKETSKDFIPYAAHDRGLVELSYSFRSVPSAVK